MGSIPTAHAHAYPGSGVGSIIFFVVVIVFGNIVILNMFLAILLDQMDDELKSKAPQPHPLQPPAPDWRRSPPLRTGAPPRP